MPETQEAVTQSQSQEQNTPPATPGVPKKQNEPSKIHRVLYYILGLIEVLLAFRFILLLFGANIEAGFAQFLAKLTDPLMIPFQGLFPVNQSAAGASIFSPSILVAMLVYALVIYGLAQLIRIFTEKKT